MNEGDVKQIADERLIWPAWVHWWPLLIGPCMIAVIYFYDPHGQRQIFSRTWQDDSYLPYVLTFAAFCAALVRAIVGRNPVFAMLTAMAFVIFYRELHWAYSSLLAYGMLVVVCVLGTHWLSQMMPYLRRGRIVQWLIMSAASYVFAVGVAKGWFKFAIPNDDVLRDFYEETLENTAHLMLLFTAVFAGRKSRGGAPPAG